MNQDFQLIISKINKILSSSHDEIGMQTLG